MNDFIYFSNFMLKFNSILVTTFYTAWALFILVLYCCGILENYQLSVFFILATVFYFGMVMTYIHPKVIVIPLIKRKISNDLLKIYNLIFHVIPLLLFLILYNTKIKNDNLLLGLVSILVYILLFNPLVVYNYKETNNNINKNIADILLLVYFLIVGIILIKQKNLL